MEMSEAGRPPVCRLSEGDNGEKSDEPVSLHYFLMKSHVYGMCCVMI